MTTALAGTDRYLAEFEDLERRDAAGTPAWLSELRRSAMARFVERGFPTTRDEDWRYTNLAPLAATPFHPARSVTSAPTGRATCRLGSVRWSSCRLSGRLPTKSPRC